jgi:hypothetical protein
MESFAPLPISISDIYKKPERGREKERVRRGYIQLPRTYIIKIYNIYVCYYNKWK